MLFLASSGEFGLICLRHAIKIKCQQLSSGLQYSLKYTKWLLCQRSFWSRDNSHIRKYTPGCTNSLKYTSPCTNVVFLHVAVAPNIAIVYAATSPHCDRGALENLCSLWVHKMPPSLGIQTTCPLCSDEVSLLIVAVVQLRKASAAMWKKSTWKRSWNLFYS